MLAQHLIALLLFNSHNSLAQEAKKAQLQSSRMMSISYGSSSWNTDSSKIDSAFLIMKDKNTGRLVRIQLEETEPDSSEFSGQFSVNISDADKVAPEVYIPPADLRSSEKDYKKLHEMIQSSKLPRKPLIWKKNEKGQSTLDVYDTREQAEAAMKAYQEQKKASALLNKKPTVIPMKGQQNEATIAAAKQAEQTAILAKLALDAANREAERVRMEQIERQKVMERDRQNKMLSEKEKSRRKVSAEQLAAEATKLFMAGDFPAAESKYNLAVEADPENKSYFLNYAITLYRNDKFNEALVAFKMAEAPANRQVEKQFYMGLTHYRLSELDAALKSFEPVTIANHPQMSASAHFYSGIIRYAQKNFEAAKKNFETVIDTSSDARMDQQAEEYLERIAQGLAYKSLEDNPWTISGLIGLQYDSNILLAPDNEAAQGSATEIEDVRLMTVADVEYRPIYDEKKEFGAKLNLNLTNSAKEEAAPADPYITNFSLPYSRKGMAFNKGYKFTLRPTFENIFMDPTSTGSKKSVLNSYYADFDNTFAMRKNWFSIFTFGYRYDDSNLATDVGDDDANASRVYVKTTQGFYLDKSNKEALLANAGVMLNMAKGNNKKYSRYELGATYVRPAKWDSTWSLGLNIYTLKYPDASETRDDFNTTLTTGLSKPIRDWVTWGVTGSYTKNTSNVAIYEYSKFVIMTTATFTTNF